MSLPGVTTPGSPTWGPITLASVIPSTPISDNIWFADGFGTWFGTGNGTTQPDSTLTWDDANQWVQLAVPGAGGTGLAEFRYRGDFSRVGAADTFYLNQMLPGVLTLTAGVTQTRAALFALSNTAIANAVAVTDYNTLYVEAPTGSGTMTRRGTIAAETTTNVLACAFHSATAQSSGTWTWALGCGSAFANGGIGYLTGSSIDFLALFAPGGFSTTGIGALWIANGSRGVGIIDTGGLVAVANREIGWSSSNPTSLGTMGSYNKVSGIDWSTQQTNDGLVWGLATNATLLFVAYANKDNDYAAATATNPTLYIYSATAAATSTAQWMSFTHNTTNGVISVGTGLVLIGGTSAFAVAATAKVFLDGGGNTSLRESAADTIAIETGGTDRWTLTTASLTTTVVQLGAAGAVGAPTWSFSGDPDTGVYSVGADSLGITAGGVLVITAAESGGAPLLGLYGAAAVARPDVGGAPVDPVLDDLIAKLALVGIITDSTV